MSDVTHLHRDVCYWLKQRDEMVDEFRQINKSLAIAVVLKRLCSF
jgi:hypothetical protein